MSAIPSHKTIYKFTDLKVGACYKWNSISTEEILEHQEEGNIKTQTVVGLLQESQHFILLGKTKDLLPLTPYRLWILGPECDGDVWFQEDDIRRLTEIQL